MSIQLWQPELESMLKGTGITVYRSNEQPLVGKFIVIYGRPGTGKTDLVASLADCELAKPIVYMNVEGGAWVFSSRDDIAIINVNTYTDFSTALLRFCAQRKLPFRTLIIDNGSELQAYNAMSVMKGGTGIKDTAMPTQGQWGASTAQMLNIARLCHDKLGAQLGVNVILTAWEDARHDAGDTQFIKSGVGFTKSLARSLPGIADIVGHLTVNNQGTRVLSFQVGPYTDAKFRRDRLEAAAQTIPLTLAFGQDHKPLVDVFNALFGNKPFPVASYSRLQGQAKVAYTPRTDAASTGTESVVEISVAQKVAEESDDEVSSDGGNPGYGNETNDGSKPT